MKFSITGKNDVQNRRNIIIISVVLYISIHTSKGYVLYMYNYNAIIFKNFSPQLG